MPCRDDRDTCFTATYDDITRAENAVRKEMEALLCDACTLLEETGALGSASAELLNWYKAHEACEQHRVRYEAAMKLTERERRLLGINLADLKLKAKIK
jgi:hypothetical protein